MYSVNRRIVLDRAEELLAINRNINGFCNLPDAMVHICVDPQAEAGLFRKQYPIVASCVAGVSACVDRWFAEGKIMLAPVGCAFNNPLLAVAKRDENGIVTGVRVCL